MQINKTCKAVRGRPAVRRRPFRGAEEGPEGRSLYHADSPGSGPGSGSGSGSGAGMGYIYIGSQNVGVNNLPARYGRD